MPDNMENPALQKADTEWNTEKNISCGNVISIVECMLSHISTAPAVSMTKVNPRMYNNVDIRERNVSDPTISRKAIWLKRPVPPINDTAKKLVIVITPKPPVWMSRAMTICPSSEKVRAMSTVDKPVTHTALVEMKMASAKERRTFSSVDLGSSRSRAPKKMMTAKQVAISRAGFVFLLMKLTTLLETSITENSPSIAIMKYFPESKVHKSEIHCTEPANAKNLGNDDRKSRSPNVAVRATVRFVILFHWKNSLIQNVEK